MDLSNPGSIQEVFSTIFRDYSRLDILVNNAAAGFYGPLQDMKVEAIEQTYQINLVGPALVLHHALKLMTFSGEKRKDPATVITVSSTAGAVGLPMMDVYSSAKFGLEGLTAALAGYMGELANVRCRVIEPGFTQTKFAERGDFPDVISSILQEFFNNFKATLDKGLSKGQTPQEVAEMINDDRG